MAQSNPSILSPAQAQAPARTQDVFCVDLEEWFHIGGLQNPYEDISLWEGAEPLVERDVDVLLEMLAETGNKATWLTVGWVADHYPKMMRKISDAGHEIGCHGYYHRMVWTQTPEQFREDIRRSRKTLQDITGQRIDAYRAPCFSMTRETFWAYPILAEEGFTIDVSLVPAPRDNGGVIGFQRDPLRLHLDEGDMVVFPVTVMDLAGRSTQFSGGGHLRAFPTRVIDYGFAQNHKAGRPVMAYIHPREVNPEQPRIKGLPIKKYFTAYYGLKSVRRKLMHMMKKYSFTTISDAVEGFHSLPEYRLTDGEMVRVREG